MLSSVGLFNRDLWDFRTRSEDEIRMINAILSSVRHSNYKGPEGACTQQFANSRLHFYPYCTATWPAVQFAKPFALTPYVPYGSWPKARPAAMCVAG